MSAGHGTLGNTLNHDNFLPQELIAGLMRQDEQRLKAAKVWGSSESMGHVQKVLKDPAEMESSV